MDFSIAREKYFLVIICLMAHTFFRGGTDHHLGTDSPRREMLPARSLYPILRLTPYKGLLGWCFSETLPHRARGRGCRHAVRTRREWPASNSGVQRRLRLQKCKAFGVIFLFAPAGIFVHVCRRCQRADRAGGIHVGLIFWQLFYQEKSCRILF